MIEVGHAGVSQPAETGVPPKVAAHASNLDLGGLGSLSLQFHARSKKVQQCHPGRTTWYHGYVRGRLSLTTGFQGRHRASRTAWGRVTKLLSAEGSQAPASLSVTSFCDPLPGPTPCSDATDWSVSSGSTTLADYEDRPVGQDLVEADKSTTIEAAHADITRETNVEILTPPQTFAHDELRVTTLPDRRNGGGSAVMRFTGSAPQKDSWECALGKHGHAREKQQSYMNHLSWINGHPPLKLSSAVEGSLWLPSHNAANGWIYTQSVSK